MRTGAAYHRSLDFILSLVPSNHSYRIYHECDRTIGDQCYECLQWILQTLYGRHMTRRTISGSGYHVSVKVFTNEIRLLKIHRGSCVLWMSEILLGFIFKPDASSQSSLSLDVWPLNSVLVLRLEDGVVFSLFPEFGCRYPTILWSQGACKESTA